MWCAAMPYRAMLCRYLFIFSRRTFNDVHKPEEFIYNGAPPGYYPQRMDQLVMRNFEPMKGSPQFATLDRTRAYTPMGSPPHGSRSPPQQHHVVNQEGIYQTIWRVKDRNNSHPDLGPLPPTPQTPRQEFPTLALEGRHPADDEQPVMEPSVDTQEDLRPSAQNTRSPTDFNTFKPNRKMPRRQYSQQQFCPHPDHDQENGPQMQPPQHSQSQPQLDVMGEIVAPFYYVLDPNHQETQDGANSMMMGTPPRPINTGSLET